MATLHIRGLDERVRDRLRVQAARHGRSMEAEARTLLQQAVGDAAPAFDPGEVQRLIARQFRGRPPRASQELIAERRRDARAERRMAG